MVLCKQKHPPADGTTRPKHLSLFRDTLPMNVLGLLISFPAKIASGGTLPSLHRTQATLQEQSRYGEPTRSLSIDRRFDVAKLSDMEADGILTFK